MKEQDTGSPSINSYKKVGSKDTWDILIVGMHHTEGIGVSFLEWSEYTVANELAPEYLMFVYEPENEYDPRAIRVDWVHNEQAYKIGYVGRYYIDSCNDMLEIMRKKFPEQEVTNSYEFKSISMHSDKQRPVDVFINVAL